MLGSGGFAEMHHPGASIARGKAAFLDLLRKTRTAVCSAYSANKETANNSIQLASIVAAAMMSAAGLPKESVLPAAVLAIKIGLDVVCKGVEHPHAGTA